MKNIKTLLFITLTLSGCSTHTREILTGTLIGSAVGAGLGYTVVHHGDHRQYVVQNTLITSGVFALATAGVLAWHYRSLDEEKIEITSKFSRAWAIDQEKNNTTGNQKIGLGATVDSPPAFSLQPQDVSKLSLRLDENTRWVFPSFRKRYLQPESSGNEILSSHYAWEIVHPGFFITKEQDSSYFSDTPELKAQPQIFNPDAEAPKKSDDSKTPKK